MPASLRLLLSGNEAVALAARQAGVALGTGYPGTPSTEILERFSELGGRGQWAPNEKVALEVALGAAFGGAAALVTMKHVGLNVAADPLFTAAYTGTPGPLVVVSADDPGIWSSQNEQDNRRLALAAGLPMLEPADSQESYDFLLSALEISRRWGLPVILRMTTRVCHSKSIVSPATVDGPGRLEPGRGLVRFSAKERPWATTAPAESTDLSPSLAAGERLPLPHPPAAGPATARFERDLRARVMISDNARPAHRRLREKLTAIAQWNEDCPLNEEFPGERGSEPDGALGIITSGVSSLHVREAAPRADVLKLGLTHPLPLERIRRFAAAHRRVVVVEEGDPCLVEQLRAAGIAVEGKAPRYRFGELDVVRVRRILAGDDSAEPEPPQGRAPALCAGCPHRGAFEVLRKLDCIVAGDIGCYSLGALPPFEALDSLVSMGASIGMGLGLRHVLPEAEARRVVSVIGDGTFIHSGITGLIEMAYNPPPTGHVVLILDNGTTAMTGLQEHPGTGRTLDHRPTARLSLEALCRVVGMGRVEVLDPVAQPECLERLLRECLAGNQLTVIIARRPCVLAAERIKHYGQETRQGGRTEERQRP